jgi:hypothetical protein
VIPRVSNQEIKLIKLARRIFFKKSLRPQPLISKLKCCGEQMVALGNSKFPSREKPSMHSGKLVEKKIGTETKKLTHEELGRQPYMYRVRESLVFQKGPLSN